MNKSEHAIREYLKTISTSIDGLGDDLETVQSDLDTVESTLANKLNSNALYGKFSVSTGAVSVTVNANNYNSNTGSAVSKSGYYPLGIVGYDITGTGSSVAVPIKYYLTDRGNGTCKVFAGLRNNGSSQANWTFTAYILWVKMT